MNPTHRAFFERPEAQSIKDVLTRPELIPQYELLSRIEVPAVQAAVWDIEPLLENLDEKTRNFAIQSSGALIGDILVSRGFRISRDPSGEKRRGRVRKSRFIKTGTIWEQPTEERSLNDERVRVIVDKLLVQYRTTLEALSK